MREKERTGEKKRVKERKGEKRREKERKGEKKERREKMSRVNYYQSAFNSQKEKLNLLAEMLEISKSGGSCIIVHRHYKSS